MLEVYLATVIVSFVTQLLIDTHRLNVVLDYGIECLDEPMLNTVRSFQYTCLTIGVVKTILIFLPIYLISTLIESLIPVLNLVWDFEKFNELYNNYLIRSSDSIQNEMDIKKMKIKNEIEESLKIDGTNIINTKIQLSNADNEINKNLKAEEKNLIDENANAILDYICMNAELTTNQKKQLLKKLKKVYKKYKFTMKPIDYTFDCIYTNEEKSCIKSK